MADRLYLRHSTDKQTDARQKHALAALLAAGAPAYEDPATSSRVLSLNRAGFKQLLDEAAVGDTVRIADAARLFRSVADIIALRPVLIRRGLHLRVESGLLSGIDLASDDPGTKMMVSVLAAVLEFQRDMISENTREGVAAAEAAGKTLGRPAALDQDQVVELVEAYREGTAVKALAREYGIAPKTVRRVLDTAGARAVPDLSALDGDDQDDVADRQKQAAEADPAVVVDVPGLVAEHLLVAADDAVRQALTAGQTIRRGQGYSVRVTTPVSVHIAMIDQSATALMQTPAGRKAHRIHEKRVTSARLDRRPPPGPPKPVDLM
ncbi:recombinase family protein [Streptomyces platensis]|uniref:recombinase family protein n=1 Tax=Streptomyces platensis TaxID=58346 RepID=UPI003787D434